MKIPKNITEDVIISITTLLENITISEETMNDYSELSKSLLRACNNKLTISDIDLVLECDKKYMYNPK